MTRFEVRSALTPPYQSTIMIRRPPFKARLSTRQSFELLTILIVMQGFVRAPVIRREISSSTVIECISVTISCCETFQSTFRFVSKRVSSRQIKFGYDGLLADGLKTQKNENATWLAGPQSRLRDWRGKQNTWLDEDVSDSRPDESRKVNKPESVVHEGLVGIAKTCLIPKHHFRTPPHTQKSVLALMRSYF